MRVINYLSQLVIPLFILFVIVYGFLKKVRVYDSFISGAKDGINIVLQIFPYILAIFIAVKSFQASGAFDFVKNMFSGVFLFLKIPLEVISIALIKPLSGSASIGVFTEVVKTTGPDSLAGKISAVIMGSAETTFYVLAVYLGSVGIKKTKYLVPVCVIADIVGIILAVVIVKLIF
ncbi:MAG: nucleoside recognition domain-containing protein [Elusimicrobiota bacterium]